MTRSKQVVVVDYGIGNLFSVQHALEAVGADVLITSDAEKIKNAERLLLPGVGAFKSGMEALHAAHLVEPIQRFAQTNRPFLGICLGMQLMFDGSDEFGASQGLGLIRGTVVKIADLDTHGKKLVVPHIGWNPLQLGRSSAADWLRGLEADPSVYFVHSFYAKLEDDSVLSAFVDYGGYSLTAAVCRGALHGVQFHPEKSGKTGLEILRRFTSL